MPGEQPNSFLKASESSPVVITRDGSPVAVIVGVQNEDDVERLLMASSAHLQAILEKSREQIRNGESLTHEQFWAERDCDRPAKKRRKKGT